MNFIKIKLNEELEKPPYYEFKAYFDSNGNSSYIPDIAIIRDEDTLEKIVKCWDDLEFLEWSINDVDVDLELIEHYDVFEEYLCIPSDPSTDHEYLMTCDHYEIFYYDKNYVKYNVKVKDDKKK